MLMTYKGEEPMMLDDLVSYRRVASRLMAY